MKGQSSSIWIRAGLAIAVLALWTATSWLHLVDPLFLPSPLQVADAFRRMFPEIMIHIAATGAKAVGAVIIGATVGTLAGFVVNLNPRLGALIYEAIEAVRPVPPIIALPLMILWFGGDDLVQMLLASLGCAVIVAVDVIVAVRNVSPSYVRAAQSLGASRWRIASRILLPSILPEMTATLRIIAMLSFTLVVAYEFAGAQFGLGYLAWRARRTLETPTILMCMLIIAIMARVMDASISLVMRRFTAWAETSEESLQKG
jgi:ABC-type nitrate/sulfonate/bicarbonate transport system permease component